MPYTPTTHNTAETQLVEANPDAAHGFLFQYPSEVAAEVNVFLANDGAPVTPEARP